MSECRLVLRRQPDHPLALMLLADAAVYARDTRGLIDTLAPLAERENSDPRLRLAFARVCETERQNARALAALQSITRDEAAPRETRRDACFQLGRILDDQGDHLPAFQAVLTGNALARKNFSRDEHRASIDAMIARTTREHLAGQPSSGNSSELPVFIVGMPRSGTTLIAHILGSHPRAVSLGERGDMTDIAERLRRESAAPNAAERMPAALQAAARDYLALLNRLAPSAARAIDKNPFNFRGLSIIARLLPGARIIHCVRNPIDTCVSCLFQNFAYPSDFTCDPEDLASYYADYKRLMDHWKKTLDIRTTEAVYEDVVRNTETEARRLVGFLGLEWDDACLRHHELKQTALTASHEQVRRPVYTSSVERWRRYQPLVDPLVDALRRRALVA